MKTFYFLFYQIYQKYATSPQKYERKQNEDNETEYQSKYGSPNKNTEIYNKDNNLLQELISRIKGLESKVSAQEKDNYGSNERKDNYDKKNEKNGFIDLESKINFLISDFTDLTEQVRFQKK